MKKVIIFDLDGTLLDTLDDLRLSVNFALAHFGYPERSREQVRKDIGHGVAKLIERSIPLGISSNNYQKCLEIFRKSYSQNYNINTRSYDGCLDMLKHLINEGYIVTVATNKLVEIAKILLDHHFPGVFDYIQGDKLGIQKKPNPDMINAIADHYHVNKDEILYIGDTNVDEETAINAEVDYALVTYGYRTTEEIKKMCSCTNLLDTPKDIIKNIKSIS